MNLNDSLSIHCIYYFFKTSYVCTNYVIFLKSVGFSCFINISKDIFHNDFKSFINFIKVP